MPILPLLSLFYKLEQWATSKKHMKTWGTSRAKSLFDSCQSRPYGHMTWRCVSGHQVVKNAALAMAPAMTHCWNGYWQTSVNRLVQYLNIQVFPHWITVQSRFCHRYVTAKEWHAWFWNAAHVALLRHDMLLTTIQSGAVEGSQQHSRRFLTATEASKYVCLNMGYPHFQYGISLIFQKIAFRIILVNLPSLDKRTVCYWQLPIYSWFTH